MSTYEIMKILIKSNRKTKEELLKYCKAYLATKKLSQTEYDELVKALA